MKNKLIGVLVLAMAVSTPYVVANDSEELADITDASLLEGMFLSPCAMVTSSENVGLETSHGSLYDEFDSEIPGLSEILPAGAATTVMAGAASTGAASSSAVAKPVGRWAAVKAMPAAALAKTKLLLGQVQTSNAYKQVALFANKYGGKVAVGAAVAVATYATYRYFSSKKAKENKKEVSKK